MALLALKRKLTFTTILRLACCAVMAASAVMLLATFAAQQLLPHLLRRSYRIYDAQQSAPARPWLLARGTAAGNGSAVHVRECTRFRLCHSGGGPHPLKVSASCCMHQHTTPMHVSWKGHTFTC